MWVKKKAGEKNHEISCAFFSCREIINYGIPENIFAVFFFCGNVKEKKKHVRPFFFLWERNYVICRNTLFPA